MKKKGIWIDSNLSGRGLSPLDKFLYSQISYYSKEEGFCVKSDREFSNELEVSERSITTSLSFLVEKGLLKKQTDRSKGNYRELHPSAKTAEPLPQELRNPSAKTAELYKEGITIKQLKEQSINNNTLNDFQKNENLVIVENVEVLEVLEISEVVILNTNTEGEKEKEKSSAKKEKETEYPFEVIWEMYGKKVGFARTEKRYEKVKECDRAKIFDHVPKYVASTPDVQYRKNFEVYLNQKSFNDQIIQKNANITNTKNGGYRGESGDEYLTRVGSELNAIFEHKFGRGSNGSTHELSNERDGHPSVSIF